MVKLHCSNFRKIIAINFLGCLIFGLFILIRNVDGIIKNRNKSSSEQKINKKNHSWVWGTCHRKNILASQGLQTMPNSHLKWRIVCLYQTTWPIHSFLDQVKKKSFSSQEKKKMRAGSIFPFFFRLGQNVKGPKPPSAYVMQLNSGPLR